jgi:hypothetical protein
MALKQWELGFTIQPLLYKYVYHCWTPRPGLPVSMFVSLPITIVRHNTAHHSPGQPSTTIVDMLAL